MFGSLYGGELVTTTSYSELAIEGQRQLQSFQLPLPLPLPSLVGHPACPPWRGMEEVPAFPHLYVTWLMMRETGVASHQLLLYFQDLQPIQASQYSSHVLEY